jgi:hypothetical protein
VAERMDHNRADALDAARMELNKISRRYLRRMKSAAEAKVNELFDAAQASGDEFDADEAAHIGVEYAREQYIVGTTIPAPQLPDAA